MKTVWVIEQGEYSDYRVVGVFTTKENADLVASKLDQSEKPKVSEWTMDPAVENLNAGRSLWTVLMLRDGTTTSVEPEELSRYRIEEQACGIIHGGLNRPNVLRVEVWATDEEHAVKIANEHRTRLIAEGEWPA